MSKLILLAGAATLAACSQAEQAPTEQAAAKAAAEAQAEVMAADGKPAYGTFKVTLGDGQVFTEEVRQDGTYTSTSATGEVETGTWVQKPGVYCTTEDKEAAKEECHPETINEDGIWVSTNSETGKTAIIERIKG
ncbi:MAG: hypothetical protein WC692_00820 [Erythrobacter sp.]|jgi:hypothetical protein